MTTTAKAIVNIVLGVDMGINPKYLIR